MDAATGQPVSCSVSLQNRSGYRCQRPDIVVEAGVQYGTQASKPETKQMKQAERKQEARKENISPHFSTHISSAMYSSTVPYCKVLYTTSSSAITTLRPPPPLFPTRASVRIIPVATVLYNNHRQKTQIWSRKGPWESIYSSIRPHSLVYEHS